MTNNTAHKSDSRSIGVFDSGIGGLTVVKELRKTLPSENIIYFGDTARLPYGTRGKDTILYYAKQDIDFLLDQHVKAIIVACGTASTVITKEECEKYTLPIFTVIDPACEEACNVSKNKNVGVIATSLTVNSMAHNISINKFDSSVNVFSKACPLLVSLVENGYIQRDNKVTRLVLEDYLWDIKQNNVDTLIMGCTHYPIVADLIGDIMGSDVTLINNGKAISGHVAKSLSKANMLNLNNDVGECTYYVSDNPDSFSDIARIFLDDQSDINATQVDINKY